MATLARIRVSWQNFPGAPGVSTFFCSDTAQVNSTAAIRSFFDAIKALLPSGLTITVPEAGDFIDDTTGVINGSWGVSPAPTVVTATGAGVYSGASGACVNWTTGVVSGGRRLQGRTFIVPLVATAYEANGTLSAAAQTTMNTAAAGLYGGTAVMVVWKRPTPFAAGTNAPINGHRIPDLAVVLRSRRI